MNRQCNFANVRRNSLQRRHEVRQKAWGSLSSSSTDSQAAGLPSSDRLDCCRKKQRHSQLVNIRLDHRVFGDGRRLYLRIVWC